MYNYNPKGNDPEEMMKSLAERIRKALVHGDPVYCGEGRMNYEEGSDYDLERGFLHFLWGPMAVGGAGNLHSWVSMSTSKKTWPDLSEQELDWTRNYSDFTKTIDWSEFDSKNVDGEIVVDNVQIRVFACRSDKMQLIYLMNDDPLHTFAPLETTLAITSRFAPGNYQLKWVNIRSGQIVEQQEITDFSSTIQVPEFRDGIFAVINKI
ncbi:MAG: hypothetical protein IPL46_19905 [Saprospiraceae bacterium]|nr:hypothetical protein [Saprospiraceae bacterium]